MNKQIFFCKYINDAFINLIASCFSINFFFTTFFRLSGEEIKKTKTYTGIGFKDLNN